MRIILSLVYGVVLGAAAVLLHNAYQPWGLMLSLVGSGLGIWLIGRAWGLRRYKFLAAVAWYLLICRAVIAGIGDERLVELNTAMGNALLFGGIITLLTAVIVNG